MLLVGAGLVPPARVEENLLYLVSLLLGAFLFIHMIASLTSRFNTALSGSHGAYQCKLENMEKWMAYNQFEPHLRQRLRVFFELKHPGGCLFDDAAILGDLSRPLREQASLHKTRELIARLHIPVDTEQGYELASRLAMALQRCVFLNGDLLIKQGSAAGSVRHPGLFFLTSGEVEIYKRDEFGSYAKCDFKAEKVVGEMSLLSRNKETGEPEKAGADVVAVTFCDAYLLRREDYEDIVDTFPLLKQWIKQVAAVRGFADYTEALKKFEELEPPETITFVKTKFLLECKQLTDYKKACTSFNVLEDFWSSDKTIYDLLPPEAFEEVKWEHFREKTYGVLTYTWRLMQWADILEKLKDTETELFWIDIFCINQRLEPEQKMRTIKQTLTIYGQASEHHILGYRTLRRGWCLCELSARRDHTPDIHSGFQDAETQAEERAAIEQFNSLVPTFSNCKFTKATDRPVVKRVIVEAWGSEHKFDDFLLQLVKQVARYARPSAMAVGESVREENNVFKQHDWGGKRRSMKMLVRRRDKKRVAPAKRGSIKGLEATFPDMKVGVVVEHPKRGRGRVIEIENDRQSDRQCVVIEFERTDFYGKQVCRYGAHSLDKLTIVDGGQGGAAAAAASPACPPVDE